MPRSFFRWLERKRRTENPRVNPFEKRAPKRSRWFIACIGLLTAGVVGLLVVALVRSPHLVYRGVRVEGVLLSNADRVKQEVEMALQGEIVRGIPRGHKWIVSHLNLKERILAIEPYEQISFDGEGDQLIVRVAERAPRALWRQGGQQELIDERGIFIRTLTAEEGQQLADESLTSPTIEILRHLIEVIQVGEGQEGELPPPQELATIFQTWGALANAGLDPREITFRFPYRFTVRLASGVFVVLSPTLPAQRQLEHLLSILLNEEVMAKHPTQIDLRFDRRVYVK